MVLIPEIREQIMLPDNVTATIENNILTVKGEKGELKRFFSHPKIHIKLNGDIIEIHSKNVRRKEKALIYTF
ncbi:MAG: 50S ribosomal protein L6, partial [Thermoplasmata archaeon]